MWCRGEVEREDGVVGGAGIMLVGIAQSILDVLVGC
jgi:hypothetical protein